MSTETIANGTAEAAQTASETVKNVSSINIQITPQHARWILGGGMLYVGAKNLAPAASAWLKSKKAKPES